jgi:hypothetical protein
MKRLFVFGCSFTKYIWPTWADIVARNFDLFQNWAQGGGGNMFIANSITECLIRNNIKSGDTVAVMWSNVYRDDIYKDLEWRTPGNVFGHSHYESCDRHLSDERGYLIRDLAIIHSAQSLVEQSGATPIFMCMVPLNNLDQYRNILSADQDVLDLYKQTLEKIKPSFFETIFNSDWKSRGNRQDLHPLPGEHLEYIKMIAPEFTISQETEKWIIKVNEFVNSCAIEHTEWPTNLWTGNKLPKRF